MRHPVSKGFTLVELLVVIAIMAVLMAILLPSLNNVRRAGRTVQCLSNLRQIGVYQQFYLSDNRGVLHPCNGRWSPSFDNQKWHVTLMGRYCPAQFNADPSSGYVQKLKPNNILTCPEDYYSMNTPLITNWGIGMSYWANNVVIPQYLWFGGNPWEKIIRKITQVKRASEIVLYYEKRGEFGSDQMAFNTPAPGGWDDSWINGGNSPWPYHGPQNAVKRSFWMPGYIKITVSAPSLVNAVFVDGHVESVPQEELFNPSNAAYARRMGF